MNNFQNPLPVHSMVAYIFIDHVDRELAVLIHEARSSLHELFRHVVTPPLAHVAMGVITLPCRTPYGI